MRTLTALLLCLPTLGWAQTQIPDYQVWDYELPPEIYQDPDRERCARYFNYLRSGDPDEIVWDSPVGPVTFRFFREGGQIPDQAMVWDVPEGYTVLPNIIELKENETDVFCITEYLGS